MEKIKIIANDFCNGKYDCDVDDSLWPIVLEYLNENAQQFVFDENKIHTLWTVNGGHLRRKASNDKLLLSILLKSAKLFR